MVHPARSGHGRPTGQDRLVAPGPWAGGAADRPRDGDRMVRGHRAWAEAIAGAAGMRTGHQCRGVLAADPWHDRRSRARASATEASGQVARRCFVLDLPGPSAAVRGRALDGERSAAGRRGPFLDLVRDRVGAPGAELRGRAHDRGASTQVLDSACASCPGDRRATHAADRRHVVRCLRAQARAWARCGAGRAFGERELRDAPGVGRDRPRTGLGPAPGPDHRGPRLSRLPARAG